MTISLAYQRLLARLYEVYDQREAANIADMVLEHVTGQRKIDRIVYKDIQVNEEQQKELERIGDELLQQKPVQQVLGHAWFMDMKLGINEHVLIPRPETEELAQWIIDDLKASGLKEQSLIDIGTGSGCIPIAVRRKLPDVAVSAVDVSDDALQVAILNSIEQKVLVDFLHLDFLDESEWKHLGKYNIIVSNPPYIKISEQSSMSDNVVRYEPHVALFVPDDNALIFYQKIARFAKNHLKASGCVYVEINEVLGPAAVELFKSYGYSDVSLRRDMQGKDRCVRALV